MPEAEDSQLDIKKRARRRLVGAIALSLFAAIIFPLVMDHDPGPQIQDIEIRIPGQDDRPLNNRLALQTPPEEAPASSTPAEPTPIAASTEPAVPTTPSESAIQKQAAAEISATPEKPSVAPVQVVDTKRAQEILNAKTAPPHEKSLNQGQFVILIGAFSSEGNVKVLRNKLTEIGVKSFTEPFGDKTRVRAGPFPTREAAEKALQKMKTISVNGQISSK
ncbi:MAG: hypothetical protein RIR18_1987 [Pseudomonadota bacterium]|jgi:DedD protein